MFYFTCNHGLTFKVYSKQLSNYSILAYLFTAMFCDDAITSYCVMGNVFCFNGFNQTAIIPRYSAHIKPRRRTIIAIQINSLPLI